MENKTHDLGNLDGCINTMYGGKLNLFDPSPDNIDIRDIASGLAFKGHFSGLTPEMFPVAQHCVLVVDLMRRAGITDPEWLLVGLLHDAPEAYIGDMVKPLKVRIPAFVEIDKRFEKVIFEKFNLDLGLLSVVKPFDIEAQKIEFEEFYTKKPETFLRSMFYRSPNNARQYFLNWFDELTQKRK